MSVRFTPALSRFLADYGMLFVLLVLCLFYGWATIAEQSPAGAAGGEQLALDLVARLPRGASVLVVGRDTEEDVAFTRALLERLPAAGLDVAAAVNGQPAQAREALERIAGAGGKLEAIACNQTTAGWAVFDGLAARLPALGAPAVFEPRAYRWPNFFKADNLLNIANQIAVIAIIAIGMTLVIIAGGIDLSVGSLIALSAVVATLLIRDLGGAEEASNAAMTLSCLAGIALCGSIGLLSGALVTAFGIPPFIVTLAMMLVASGLAFLIAEGHSIYQVPERFVEAGRGTLFGFPIAVLLMAALYAAAHVTMTRTFVGRYIYAVGGNAEAARLSGVPVRRIQLLVYTVCGLLAGLGGVVMASQLKSGAPTYGQMYELYVIAAVVVGGTSLSGGEGKVLGTLIGALIIAVIQNGMNLTGVESYTQKVVLGLVILGAVLLDLVKRRGWSWIARRRAA